MRGSLAVDPKENRITIERENGSAQTYDPRRLSGVSVHREAEREFSNRRPRAVHRAVKRTDVANRELGTIEQVNSYGNLKIRMDSGREFDSISASTRILITVTQ